MRSPFRPAIYPVYAKSWSSAGVSRKLWVRLHRCSCRFLKSEPCAAVETDDDFDFEPFAWVGPYIADNALPPLRTSSPHSRARTNVHRTHAAPSVARPP